MGKESREQARGTESEFPWQIVFLLVADLIASVPFYALVAKDLDNPLGMLVFSLRFRIGFFWQLVLD